MIVLDKQSNNCYYIFTMCKEINLPELIELAKLDSIEEKFLQELSNEQSENMQNLKEELKKGVSQFIGLGKTQIEKLTLKFKKRIEGLKKENERILFFEKWSLSLCLDVLKNES